VCMLDICNPIDVNGATAPRREPAIAILFRICSESADECIEENRGTSCTRRCRGQRMPVESVCVAILFSMCSESADEYLEGEQ
jgi:hypothetical protein